MSQGVTDRELFQYLERAARMRWYPKLRVRSKHEFWVMQFINWITNLFTPKAMKDDFMNRFWSTMGYLILYPTPITPDNLVQWHTLMHELVHCGQKKKWGITFNYLYAWPLSQGGLLLATCWLPVFWASGWWLALWIGAWAAIAGLHFIPQLPDPLKAHWEYQAFCISMFCFKKKHGIIPDEQLDFWVQLFVDMSYFKMDINKPKILAKFIAAREAIMAGKVPKGADPYYTQVVELYTEFVG